MLSTIKLPQTKSTTTQTNARRTKAKLKIEVDLSGEWPAIGGWRSPVTKKIRPFLWEPGYFIPCRTWNDMTEGQQLAIVEFLKAKGRVIRKSHEYGETEPKGYVHMPTHRPVSFGGWETHGHNVLLNAPSCRNEHDISIFIMNSDSEEEAEFRVRQFLEDLMKCGLAAA